MSGKTSIKFPEVRNTERYIIAIGASAGGLEAIHEFFDHMPANSGFTFIVIQHLSPDYKSLLVELVSKHTHMKVFEAANDLSIQPDCVYIIPNKKLMTIKGNKLKLADKIKDKSPNTAIDTFLHTLAKDRREKAIAIILSGTGTDGTKGIEAVKECGGMVIVQDPATAKFDGMPNSAITSGNADFILPPSKMHVELYNYLSQEPVKELENNHANDGLLEEVFALVLNSSGQDFNLYKTPTILRRISRRMTALNVKNLPAYVDVLKENAAEVKILAKDFLIGVTKFFRDKAAFEFIAENVLPAIVENKVDGEVLKVWVCACSTGEEAYTIALIINEYLENVNRSLEVKIFATDVDDTSIDIAAHNQYPLSIAKEIPEPLLKKYFVKEGKSFSVIPSIRKQIVFARHNVIKSPPFIKNDLVTCRNMLIYMNNLLQQKVLSTFHFSLNPNGYLMLGGSETASAVKDGFTELSSKNKVYQKTGSIHYSPHHTYSTSVPSSLKKPVITEKLSTPEIARTIEDDFKDFVVEEMGCVGIFIDKNYDIKETIGDFGKYLSLPEKKLELNVLKMVPKEVSLLLNTAIRKAWKENKKTYLKRIRVQSKKDELFLNISIKPADAQSTLGYTLILFAEARNDVFSDSDFITLPTITGDHQNEYLLEMEAELNETRNNLQMAIEEMETTNEELQSSNEELLSANEELQSGNEELQSLNEELHTLNTEHQIKIRELIELNDDLDNYFRSTDIGQIFIDANLRIRKFNPAAVKLVNLIESDIGRPINHISSNIDYDNFISDIHTVLAKGELVEKEVSLKNGNRNLMRIMPYLRKDSKRDGVVISFVDISIVTELNNIIAGVFNSSPSLIMAFRAIKDTDNRVVDFKCVAKNAAADLVADDSAKGANNYFYQKYPSLFEHGFFEKYVKVIANSQSLQAEVKLKNDNWYQLIAAKMEDGLVLSLTDITLRKQAEQKLRKNYNELIKVREDLKKLNNELEDKIQERTLKLSQSEERFKLVSKATNDTIWDWNLVNNTMWRSDNFQSMFGYEPGLEASSVSFWFEKIHADDRDCVKNGVYAAINGNNENWSAEYRFLRADGTYAEILDRGNILKDDYGTPYRMVGSVIDITLLKDTENQLKISENKFRRIFESNMIGMLFCDADGRIVDANDAYLNMIGYTREDWNIQAINWRDITPPEFTAVSDWAREQLVTTGICPPFEKQYIRKDGSRVSVLMGAAILEADEQLNNVSYIIDISKQKENDRRRAELQDLIKKQKDEFYSIFMNAPALITIRRGSHLIYEFVNKAFVEFNGDKEYIGNTSAEVTSLLDTETTSEIEGSVYKTGETYIGRAFRVERLNQKTDEVEDCWFDLIYTPVYSSAGQIDGIAFFGFDVTDLVKGQRATRDLMKKKDEFLSIASHELKTPITSLKGSLQIIQRLIDKKGDLDAIFPFVFKAGKQIGKITTLVDDLLDVTRIQAGKMLFNYSEFDASEMIKDCVDEVQTNTDTHQISIEANPAILINADRHRLEQVISNFLSNAIKYSPDSNEIVVKSQVVRGKLRISVTDFGIGIPESQKQNVFNRFFRVQESSNKFSGLGLGLYISHEIVKRHGGRTGVNSKEGSGSTFWFTVPILQ